VITDYVELDDDALRHRIAVTMDDMFGFLASETGPALLLGEFGGLYAKDAHPMKTTKRCTDFTLEIIKQPGWAGGFVWSLNPESAYQFNPADKAGTFTEGVLNDDWLSSNEEFLAGMAAFDDMEGLQQFPCFPYDAPSSAESTSASASASGSA
jgi:endoglucanase